MIKSKERTDQTAEFFTPAEMVDEILSKLKKSRFEDPSYSTLDPACGNGQFIVGVLNKKVNAYLHKDNLSKEEVSIKDLINYKTSALKESYGVDLMASNIADLIARIVFWKMWNIEIFDIRGHPKKELKGAEYNNYDDAYWLKKHIESGGEYKRVYEYGEHRVAVRVKAGTKKWWRMKYSILGAGNKDYTGGGFCSNFVVADGLKYNYEFGAENEPALETHSEIKVREQNEQRIRKNDQCKDLFGDDLDKSLDIT